MGLPGPPGPPGAGVGICIPHPKLSFGCSWCLGCCLIPARVSLTGPTGCPWAARTSGECVVPLPCPASISVGAGGRWGGCETQRPSPALAAGRGRAGSRGCRAGTACQGRMARLGCRGRWYVAAHPVLSQWEPPCAQLGGLKLRAVHLVPGFAGTIRSCRSQGRARGCRSPRAGECRAGSFPGVPGLGWGRASPCSPADLSPLSRASLALLVPKGRR